MTYDLELDKAVKAINDKKAKLVLVQLPNGLKLKANAIQNKLEKETEAQILIWAGSCFGACDVPLEVERLGVDLIIQWGHSEYII